MTMPKFTLGRFEFLTKKAAVAAVRQVLNRVGRPYGQLLAGDEEELIRAVLDRHPNRDEKLAGGYVGMTVKENIVQGASSRGFHIMHPDGTSTAWSYRVAMRLAASIAQVTAAARWAVRDDILAFRMARFATGATTCDETGKPLWMDDAHVDHGGEWPFERIVKEFVEIHGQPAVTRETCEGSRFDDPEMAARFREFHNERAQLRIVHKNINLRGAGAHIPARPVIDLEAMAENMRKRRANANEPKMGAA